MRAPSYPTYPRIILTPWSNLCCRHSSIKNIAILISNQNSRYSSLSSLLWSCSLRLLSQQSKQNGRISTSAWECLQVSSSVGLSAEVILTLVSLSATAWKSKTSLGLICCPCTILHSFWEQLLPLFIPSSSTTSSPCHWCLRNKM